MVVLEEFRDILWVFLALGGGQVRRIFTIVLEPVLDDRVVRSGVSGVVLLKFEYFGLERVRINFRLAADVAHNKFKQIVLSRNLTFYASSIIINLTNLTMNKFNKKLTISVPEESECSQDETLGMGKPQPPDKESLLQFRDFRDGVDSEGGETRQEHPSNRLNYVQFEEFSISKFNPRENLKSEGDSVKTPKHKRNFTIELPDRDGEKGNQKKLKTQQLEGAQVQREPPAPPKGSRTSKVFVFPNSPHKEEESSDIMKQSFQRERQEFYREKSRLEKQILIKNGQIDMLQKIVKEKYSFQSLADKRYQSFNSEEGFQRMQRILLEKDLEINELLEKIAYLNEALEKKSEEFNKRLIENATLETLIESLRNQIYIYEKKDNNEKLSKKFFYYQKERERANEWVEDDLDISMGHIDYGRKGIEQLNKRIQMIRNNRKEINSRQKINSEYSSYSQSTKNRPKGAFDFKSKMHEDSKLNRTRMF